MMWYGSDMTGWGYAFMAVGSILFWALLIAAIVAEVVPKFVELRWRPDEVRLR